MNQESIYYSVGPLLYCPADKPSVAETIRSQKFGTGYSLALCLEDTINDSFVAEAEDQLLASVQGIYASLQEQSFYLPKLFIRVRSAAQITDLAKRLGDSFEIITGFILPKFSPENVDAYLTATDHVCSDAGHPCYFMPIYESASIIDLRTRYDTLYQLKEKLAAQEAHVLNIRVGGNDLCHLFGLRRERDESIHRISPVEQIFADIVTVYGMDYVISGPVYEYYAGDGWENGLRTEIKDDRLCGFTGKTIIHPNQIPVVKDSCKVSHRNYEDARAILDWNTKKASYVSGDAAGERMDEYKTHSNWARKICFLAETFGVYPESRL